MSATLRRRGRPLGEASRAFLQAVSIQPLPARAVAVSLQISASLADRTAFNLKRGGYTEVVSREETPGRRPVDVYGAASWVTDW